MNHVKRSKAHLEVDSLSIQIFGQEGNIHGLVNRYTIGKKLLAMAELHKNARLS